MTSKHHSASSTLVRDVMSKTYQTCLDTDPISVVIDLMPHNKDRAILVLDSQQQLVGIVTESNLTPHREKIPHLRGDEGDFRLYLWGYEVDSLDNAIAQAISSGLTVGQALKRQSKVYTASPADKLEDVLYLIDKQNIRRIPVVENDKVVGLLTYRDVFEYEARLARALLGPEQG